MRTASLAVVLLVSIPMVGCRTTEIPNFEPIEVPRGLSIQQVELAILSGILNKPPPQEYDPSEPIPDEEFRQFLWDHYLSTARGRSWFPETFEPGTIRAAVNTRGHYLSVTLDYDVSEIHTRIDESRELLQTETRIHGRAIKWINRLHQHIRRELGRMAFSPAPAARVIP